MNEKKIPEKLSVFAGLALCRNTATGLALVLSAILLFVAASSQREEQGQLATVPEPGHACGHGRMCARVVTGAYESLWTITGEPGNLNGIADYRRPAFQQKVLSRTDTSVQVRVRCTAVLPSEALFPLDTASLPARVRGFLQPAPKQQSDHRVIIEQARTLTAAAQTEAQAVVAILDWVRAHVAYDYSFSLPRDAVSVYRNCSGVCKGFSNLAVALLRAVGVPARVVSGCALWSEPHGGGHAWIEVYYPDAGWVMSEPQKEQNFVSANRLVDPEWRRWCGEGSTLVSGVLGAQGEELYRSSTPYPDGIWRTVFSANVPAWDRHPVQVSVSRLSLMVARGQRAVAHMEVASTHCHSTTWELSSSAPWVQLSPSQGTSPGKVRVDLRTQSLPLGIHAAQITVTTPASWGDSANLRTVPVEVNIVERVWRAYLPLAAR